MQDEVISQIKQKLDIVSVIEKYLELKPAGKNFTAKCPFHSEKTASFNVSPELQIFKCFGCGKTGDLITFVMEIEKLEFVDAKKKLAEMAGIKIEERHTVRNYIYELNERAAKYFQKSLTSSTVAQEYLKGRGLTPEDIKKFGIGFAPRSGNFLSYVKTNFPRLNKSQLLSSGLFVERNNTLREKFQDRIMFPIFNVSGEIIGFTGRKLPNNDYGPKYINTPETAIFHKSNNVYGLNFAKYSIRKENLCIICEGTTDVIATHKAGINIAVAPLGTSLTKEQLQLISQYTKNILFIFDSDNAGQKALERAFEMANHLELTSYAINTLPYKDIDEMVKVSPQEFSAKVEKRTDAFSYLIASKIAQLDLSTLRDLNTLKAFANNLLIGVNNQETKKFYITQLKSLLGEKLTYTEPRDDKWIPDQRYKRPQKNDLEISLLSSILKAEPISVGYIDFQYLSNDIVKQIIQLIREENITSLNELHKKLENTETKAFIEMLVLKSGMNKPENPQVLYDRIISEYIHDSIVTLKALLAAAEKLGDEKSIDEINNKIFDLTIKLKIQGK